MASKVSQACYTFITGATRHQAREMANAIREHYEGVHFIYSNVEGFMRIETNDFEAVSRMLAYEGIGFHLPYTGNRQSMALTAEELAEALQSARERGIQPAEPVVALSR